MQNKYHVDIMSVYTEGILDIWMQKIIGRKKISFTILQVYEGT